MLRVVRGIAAGVLLAAGAGAASEVTFERLDDRIVVRAGQDLFTEYRFKERRPCLFPVINSAGRLMTRRWPLAPSEDHPESKDHPHHTGIWFAHGDVRHAGVERMGDFWHHDRIEHENFIDFEEHAKQGTLLTENTWRHRDGTVLCTDRTRMTFGQAHGDRWIDFDVTLKAPAGKALVLGDTKEGTMAIRIPETMTLTANDKKLQALSQGAITNSEGVENEKAWGKRAKWCAYHGPADGAPAVIAIFDHPGNPRHPTWWMVRPYGLFAANAFGKSFFEKAPKGSGAFTIPPGQSATFRYRFLFQAADFNPTVVEARYAEYVAKTLKP